jgi:hypothetical protein
LSYSHHRDACTDNDYSNCVQDCGLRWCAQDTPAQGMSD